MTSVPGMELRNADMFGVVADTHPFSAASLLRDQPGLRIADKRVVSSRTWTRMDSQEPRLDSKGG